MSNQYPGGIITKNPATPTGPYETGAAPGIWTLTQQAGYKQQGVWPTAGLSNNFIEEVFSCFLYTGNSSTQTITNNIDLSTKGGLVWIKRRTSEAHYLFDTSRGPLVELNTDGTDANQTKANSLTSFNTTGFSLGSYGGSNYSVAPDNSYVSWTFRKQPKFFDIVTYTGDGTNNRQIAHNLQSTPGFITTKSTGTTGNWVTWHRSYADTTQNYQFLNLTTAVASFPNVWGTQTSTYFTVGTGGDNASGVAYVAYLFAHDAGGFGLTGTDNVISCGSYTGVGGGNVATITLGYEPQWILVKRTDNSAGGNWAIFDNMRGMSVNATDNAAMLNPNLSDAESVLSAFKPTATGFQTGANFTALGGTYIYIAIRRGPMKVPTLGTSVFSPQVQTPSGAGDYVMAGSSGFPIDWLPTRQKSVVTDWYQTSRLTNNYMSPNTTAAEGAYAYNFALMQGVGAGWSTNDTVSYAFRRAPGFFDVVCYTGGTGTPRVLNHNLTTLPELVITKIRNFSGEDWVVNYSNGSTITGGYLNSTAAFSNSSTAPSTDITSLTSTTYTLNTSNRRVNGAYNYVAYLFATCAGVSKVGSYTGTGTTLQINCGFTAGARFVLIKRTDSTGDWYVWDSARGIVAGNDPYLLLNSTAAEVTGTDYVDTYSAGFEISSTAPAAINASAGTFIFLAIA